MSATEEWVNVNERLPDKSSCYVLVAMSTGLVVSTFYCEHKEYFDGYCGKELRGETDDKSAHFDHARKYGYRVTHWRYLPLPPAKGERE